MSKSLKVILIISTLDTNNSHIKFIWKCLSLIFEIIRNLIQFFWNFKININDVIEFVFWDEFSPFCKNKSGHQHQQNILIFFTFKKNDIIVQWNVGLIAKI
jgi:hypothetical protein